MPRYLAFLRGINLGNRRIKMDVLRAHFDALNFADVETFIASGNVIFTARETGSGKLENKIAAHLEKSLGYAVDTFVRTPAELAEIVGQAPFAPSAYSDPASTIHVGFLWHPLTAAQAEGLGGCRSPHDEFHVSGREYHWLCRGIKSHESKVWTTPAFKALRLPSSSLRNLTTLRKLAALYPPSEG